MGAWGGLSDQSQVHSFNPREGAAWWHPGHKAGEVRASPPEAFLSHILQMQVQIWELDAWKHPQPPSPRGGYIKQVPLVHGAPHSREKEKAVLHG